MASYFSRSTIHHNLSQFLYKSHDRNGVICLVVAGLVSLAAIFYLLVLKPPKPGSYRHTHLFGYLVCLLFANFLLSASTVMSLKWIVGKQVTLGGFCTAQGTFLSAENIRDLTCRRCTQTSWQCCYCRMVSTRFTNMIRI